MKRTFVIRRNGSTTNFDQVKISTALMNAFVAVNGATSQRIKDRVDCLTTYIIDSLERHSKNNETLHIENIQDVVELTLMRSGEHDVARAYVIYREDRARDRAKGLEPRKQVIMVDQGGGSMAPLVKSMLLRTIAIACKDLEPDVNAELILKQTLNDLYDGVSIQQIRRCTILAARSLIEKDPAYSYVAAKLLLSGMYFDITGGALNMSARYAEYFPKFIKANIESGLLSPEMSKFNLNKLAKELESDRDLQFNYIGLQTLYDRYFLRVKDDCIELPQAFFMRVAMGIAINERNHDDAAIKFYHLLSKFDFMCSTPTLFNSGLIKSQLSSCYVSTVPDDLSGIFDCIKENALLAKFSGGLGNDWTNVRAMGSHIKGTNGKSQGVIPFLKIANDTAVAVNQGGKRKGALCSYLETWHLDIEEFLELRKNTGDDRRRTHDMNTANWIPDLFMKRVISNEKWTLFDPAECPDLHGKFGDSFVESYEAYELRAENGGMTMFKLINASDLWRKMLSMLFETGHPWITFKDACNVRSPQQHVGVINGSNLCTEITLNTSEKEIAVCNLGSVNLKNHLKTDGSLDINKIKQTVETAMRMLNNIIDINYYAVGKAKQSNLTHRPVGLGIMGFQDCLHILKIPYGSQEAVEFSDRSMETVCYYAYKASSDMSALRGTYESFNGSLWDQGIMPKDSLELLRESRGKDFLVFNDSENLDWVSLRSLIRRQGMHNSNCVAIAPTATIANIIGVSPSIEPTYQNLFVKSNLSGEFIMINEYLVKDLKQLGLWDDVMIADLKYYNGSVASIERIPPDVRYLYSTAFEIDPEWVVEAAARRQKWIDQSQSLNIYIANASGRKLDEIYKLAWMRGLKTTYYLRALGATSAEKSTSKIGELNAVQPSAMCSLDDQGCESCQ